MNLNDLISKKVVNQDLRTTDDVTFNSIISTGDISTTSGTIAGLTAVELTQLGNIDTTTISIDQWGYVGTLGRSLATTDTPEFAGLGNISVSPTAYISFMAAGAGNVDISGNGNILIGHSVGRVIADAEDNIVLGTESGYNITSGSYNVLLGYMVAQKVDTGANNIFIGQRAGDDITSGSQNVILGHMAGEGNQIGDANVAIGPYAGNGVFGNSNSYNTFLGGYAGNDITTGSYNTTIGSHAGDGLTSGEKVICIGYNSTPTDGTVSNICLIGGTGIDVVSVGLGGNDNPQYELDVTGDINFTGTLYDNGVAYVPPNPFDQDLNTTDTPTFKTVTAGEPWIIHTTTVANEGITAVVNNKYMVDTTNSTANIVLTIPTVDVGDTIKVTDMKGNFSVGGTKNVVTSTAIFEGVSQTIEFDAINSTIEFVYTGASYGWKLITT